MKIQFSISEHTRGKICKGTISFGKKKFFWLLVCSVPFSKMNKEVERRQKRGQDVRSEEASNELFTLVVLDSDWNEVCFEGNEFKEFLAYIILRTVNFHDASISEVWNKLSDGTGATPFFLKEEGEIDDETCPAAFR